MWTAGFIYALKAGLVLAILYAAYGILFKKNTRYALKRTILMGIVVISLGLPFVKLQLNHQALPKTPIMEQVEAVLPATVNGVPDAEFANTIVSQQEELGKPKTWSWPVVLLLVYWAGVSVSLLLMLWQLGQLLFLVGFAAKRHDLGRLVVTHRTIKYPFSFWKWTFLPPNFEYDQTTWKIVNRHELAHQEQVHSLDLILLSLFRSLLWFNPIVYLLQKSVRENHEFLADQSVLKFHSLHDYGQALLAVCLESPSMPLAHSFSLKSNLSKRLNQMNSQRTSVVRSGVALSALVAIALLVMTQVSLYAQQDSLKQLDDRLGHIVSFDAGNIVPNFNSYKIFQATGETADSWLRLDKQLFPLILLDDHKKILADLEEKAKTEIMGQSDFDYHLLLGKTADAKEAYRFKHPLRTSKAELVVHLSVNERLAIYQMADAWTKRYVHQVYPKFELISEVDFMQFEYLFFMSQPSSVDPRRYGINNSLDVSKVDVAPKPYGGMERFLKNVIKYSPMDSSLTHDDLPKKIEFEFTIDTGGNLVLLNPVTKVRGPEKIQDKVYAWLGLLNKNIIKVSQVYQWEPGRKDNLKVPTRMRLEIPKRLL